MNVAKFGRLTVIDTSAAIAAVDAAIMENVQGAGGAQTQSDKPVQDAPFSEELTADDVSLYLQPILARSCNSIDNLIGDLRHLRERLIIDGACIEQGIAEFANLNQSVMKLTAIVVEEVTHIQAPGVAV